MLELCSPETCAVLAEAHVRAARGGLASVPALLVLQLLVEAGSDAEHLLKSIGVDLRWLRLECAERLVDAPKRSGGDLVASDELALAIHEAVAALAIVGDPEVQPDLLAVTVLDALPGREGLPARAALLKALQTLRSA